MSADLLYKPTLADAFAPLLAYVAEFARSAEAEPHPYEEVRGRIMTLLKESETLAMTSQVKPEEYDQARYAVCAWVDEAIFASRWPHRMRWRPEMLQRVFYGSADGGEAFFERLRNLEPPEQEARAVFTLCLALGFKGRYCAPDDQETLDKIRQRNLKLVFNSVADKPVLESLEEIGLFPEGYPRAALVRKPTRRMSPWEIGPLVIPVVILMILYLAFWLSLQSAGRGVLKAVGL